MPPPSSKAVSQKRAFESSTNVLEPPLKAQYQKQAATEPREHDDSKAFPRISKKLTMEELREEAIARKIDPKTLPKTKGELLHMLLLEGSIHLKETNEYKQYMQVVTRMERERPQLLQQAAAARALEEGNRQERQRKQQENRIVKLIEKRSYPVHPQQQQETEHYATRTAEIEAQKRFHSHFYPLVHPHKMACTTALKINGQARNQPNCDCCRFRISRLDKAFTCEVCDWDICGNCFEERNATPEERDALFEMRRKDQEKLRKEWERNKQQQTLELEKRRKMQEKLRIEWERENQQREIEFEREWKAENQFSANIIKPPAQNKSFTTKGHKYVVWSSDKVKYINMETTQQFDSSWKTIQEANDRARYLFFWENAEGAEPNELGSGGDDGTINKSLRVGLVTYTIKGYRHIWTVGVVPTAAFLHLGSPRFDNEI